MNKKIITIMLVILLALSATTSIIATTSLQKDDNYTATIESEYSSTNNIGNENKNITKTITVTTADKKATKKSVSYVSSEKYSDNYTVDIYTDTESNEYIFTGSSELVGYNRHNRTVDEILNPEKYTDRLQDKSETNAIDYAEKFASNFFGDEFYGFVFEETQMIGTDIYYILFELPAGKDNSVQVRRCAVCINKDGFIQSAVLSQKYYSDFADLDVLNNITKEDIVKNVTGQLTKMFSDAKEISVKKAYLTEDCDSLRIEAEFTTELDTTSKLEGYNFGFIGDTRYLIILYYPLS